MIITVFAPHVDDQRQRVSDAYGSAHPVAGGSVSVPYFHVTLGRRQRENDRIARGHSVTENVDNVHRFTRTAGSERNPWSSPQRNNITILYLLNV